MGGEGERRRGGGGEGARGGGGVVLQSLCT